MQGYETLDGQATAGNDSGGSGCLRSSSLKKSEQPQSKHRAKLILDYPQDFLVLFKDYDMSYYYVLGCTNSFQSP